MLRLTALPTLLAVAVLGIACGRSPFAPPEGTKVAVVPFSLSRGISVQSYDGGHPGNDGYLAASAATEPAARQRTVSDRLQELDQLRTKGVISDEEYAAQRRRLIGEL